MMENFLERVKAHLMGGEMVVEMDEALVLMMVLNW